MKLWTDFHVALTFLTPLGRATITSPEQIRSSMAMYPLVGWFLGAMLALTAVLPVSSWILAWGLIGMNIGLTRGLHWDGWADLWDGWGSGATGEKFWAIIKDSRIGAFGTMGLILGLGCLAANYELAVREREWLVLAWSCAFGRFCCLVLARLGRDLARPGLGQNALLGATPSALCWGGTLTFGPALFIPAGHVGAAMLLVMAPIFILLRFGRQRQGINGDFLGAAIIAGEICALLPLAI